MMLIFAIQGDEDWAICTQEGLKHLRDQETDFTRPPESSDKLYMTIGEKDVIEVAHPTPPYVDPKYFRILLYCL